MWRIAKHTRRRNVLVTGQEYGYSDAFGVIRPRVSKHGQEIQLSVATKEYPDFVELIVTGAKQEFDIIKTFPFTTFTINGGLQTKIHRGSNNAGASCIIGLGDYKQGRLFYWDQDDKNSLWMI